MATSNRRAAVLSKHLTAASSSEVDEEDINFAAMEKSELIALLQKYKQRTKAEVFAHEIQSKRDSYCFVNDRWLRSGSHRCYGDRIIRRSHLSDSVHYMHFILTHKVAFQFFFDLPTRWNDNDQFGHVNNVIYYSYFDTAINKYLIQRGGFRPTEDESVGYCVHSYCTFREAVSFPDVLHVGLSVVKVT